MCGKRVGNLWNSVETLWKVDGKCVERGWKVCGKRVGTLWKSTDQLDLSPSYVDLYPSKGTIFLWITANHIPVDAYIQETKILHECAMRDIDVLASTGLSRTLVEDLPVRVGALVEAESLLFSNGSPGMIRSKNGQRNPPLPMI